MRFCRLKTLKCEQEEREETEGVEESVLRFLPYLLFKNAGVIVQQWPSPVNLTLGRIDAAR